MPNYQEGKIYKIYNTVNDGIYVGSTTLKLCERLRDHRRRYRTQAYTHLLLYKAFAEYGVDNFYIELIEKCPCNDKDEAHKKEGWWIRELRPSLNKAPPGRTKQEYQEYYKTYFSECNKTLYKNNKDIILETAKSRYQANKEDRLQKVQCECGCVIAKSSLWKHKESKKHNDTPKNTLTPSPEDSKAEVIT